MSHSSRESLIFHLHHLCFSWPPTMFVPPSLLVALPSSPSLLSLSLSSFFFFLVSSWVKGEAARRRRAVRGGGFAEGPQWALCPSPKQYLPQPSLGSLETKPVLIPPNEPTQQSLLLDLYLLKSGEEKSSSFSTFPGICRLIDCFARAVCIFWNAWIGKY